MPDLAPPRPWHRKPYAGVRSRTAPFVGVASFTDGRDDLGDASEDDG